MGTALEQRDAKRQERAEASVQWEIEHGHRAFVTYGETDYRQAGIRAAMGYSYHGDSLSDFLARFVAAAKDKKQAVMASRIKEMLKWMEQTTIRYPDLQSKRDAAAKVATEYGYYLSEDVSAFIMAMENAYPEAPADPPLFQAMVSSKTVEALYGPKKRQPRPYHSYLVTGYHRAENYNGKANFSCRLLARDAREAKKIIATDLALQGYTSWDFAYCKREKPLEVGKISWY